MKGERNKTQFDIDSSRNGALLNSQRFPLPPLPCLCHAACRITFPRLSESRRCGGRYAAQRPAGGPAAQPCPRRTKLPELHLDRAAVRIGPRSVSDGALPPRLHHLHHPSTISTTKAPPPPPSLRRTNLSSPPPPKAASYGTRAARRAPSRFRRSTRVRRSTRPAYIAGRCQRGRRRAPAAPRRPPPLSRRRGAASLRRRPS